MGIQPIRKIVTPEIPDKLYFRIGDVARLCEVPAYVLRFWETEFPQLKPTKGGTGQRLYRKRDVEMALRIKSLLYDQRYTIPGARQVFKDEVKAREQAAAEAFLPTPAPAEANAQPKPSAVPAELSVVPAVPSTVPAELSTIPAPTVAVTPPATPVNPGADPGAELRRQMKLRALREELRALLSMLEPGRGALAAAPPEPKPLRPRLVLEPRFAPARAEAPRLETLRLVREPQRETSQTDLFTGE